MCLRPPRLPPSWQAKIVFSFINSETYKIVTSTENTKSWLVSPSLNTESPLFSFSVNYWNARQFHDNSSHKFGSDQYVTTTCSDKWPVLNGVTPGCVESQTNCRSRACLEMFVNTAQLYQYAYRVLLLRKKLRATTSHIDKRVRRVRRRLCVINSICIYK